MNRDILKDVENYIFKFYKENAPAKNVYHNLAHIKSVVEYVKEIGENSAIEDDDMEQLLIAAWFHDIGHIFTWDGHEKVSMEHCREYLSKKNYPADKIDTIAGCILATQIPHNPKNQLEEIICDADIAHVGSNDFFDQSDLLKLEIEKREIEKISDSEWLKKNIEFLTQNKFFTKYARLKFEERKNANLLKLQKKYKKKIKKKNESKIKGEKLALEKEKFAQKTADLKKADRGVETMFRNIMRTHVSFSSMADSKANIMISVNTILLGAVFTILARKLDSNPHLIIPTIVLTLVSLVTLILAVRVTRPSVSSGVFTKEDIQNKDANLLFFGNFFKMNLQDFSWGMQEMMKDRDFLYGSMIKDFYFLGQVLGRKYKLLRLCYTIFMYGITIAAALFAYYIWTNPTVTDLNNLIE